MTDNRPAPEYGEYATPEEQRERMGLPPVADDTASAGVVAGSTAASSGASGAVAASAPAQRYSPPPPEFVPEEGATRRSRRAGQASAAPAANPVPVHPVTGAPVAAPRDRGISIFLLILGALSMIGYVGSFQRLSVYIQMSYDQLNMGTISTASRMDIIGWVTLGLLVILYVITLRWTTVRLGARKLTWFIPLAAGVLAAIISMIAIGTAMIGDPTFMEMATNGTLPTMAP